MKKLILLTTIILSINQLSAQIINIPDDYPTIQQGINAAINGDTVLVQPGIYIESIWISNDITVASLFMFSQDTSVISQTIIDGNQNSLSGSVVSISNGTINGFTITNGLQAEGHGGGINCGGSDTRLLNLIVCDNTALHTMLNPGIGGGIYCSGSPYLHNLVISNNSAFVGGGIFFEVNSNPILNDVQIKNNTAQQLGGGVYCYESYPAFENVLIKENSVVDPFGYGFPLAGGGIFLNTSSPTFKNVNITNNNAGDKGGGIYSLHSNPVFDSTERCSIYLNFASGEGNDLYADSLINVVLDTFTVLNPTSYLAAPLSNFNFNILHGLIPQANADLYVSPLGNNSNSGLTPDEAIKNIYYAFIKILADDLNHHTIYLQNGTYSPLSNNEIFPLYLPDFISLIGTSQLDVILDAEQNTEVLKILNCPLGYEVSNMTITHGTEGIHCLNSNPLLKNLFIRNNTGYGLSLSWANALLENLTISDNLKSGLYCYLSSPIIIDGSVRNNSAPQFGGGMYFSDSNPVFDTIVRCNIYSNHAPFGKDIFSNQPISVFVDTFSVLNPTSYYLHPFSNITMDVLHGLIPQTDTDVYVDPNGDNGNSGLTTNDPLKTIDYAMSIILSTETNPHTIHLLSGTYSPSTNGELYPLFIPAYMYIAGESEQSVILDAEELSGVLEFQECPSAEISNITVTGGVRSTSGGHGGGGMVIMNSNPVIQNVSITGNSCFTGTSSGGGVWCVGNSSPVFKNVTISNNTSSSGGGGMAFYDSTPEMENMEVTNNSSNGGIARGGGLSFSHSNAVLKNCLISENNADNAGGGIACNSSNLFIINVTLSDNTSEGTGYGQGGGGLFCYNNSKLIFINSIAFNNEPQSIYFQWYGEPNSLSTSWSDIQGGQSGIQTNGNGTVNWLEGNINEEPLFIGSGEHPYILANESPCINSGIPDTSGLNLPELDLAGNSRFFGGRIEMGAYENQEMTVSVLDQLGQKTKFNLNISPNPVTENATIQFSLTSYGSFDFGIYNTSGICLKSWQFKNQQPGEKAYKLDLKDLPAGIYFCRVQIGNEIVTKKIIKVN